MKRRVRSALRELKLPGKRFLIDRKTGAVLATRDTTRRRRYGNHEPPPDPAKCDERVPYWGFVLGVLRTDVGGGGIWRVDIWDSRGVYVWFAFGETSVVALEAAKRVVDHSMASRRMVR